jgi:hypothetical protein
MTTTGHDRDREWKTDGRNPMTRATLFQRLAVAILALFGALALAPSTARAETETWSITSSYPYQVQLEFYSKDRDAAWPGASRAYLLDDSKEHKFSLNCQPGERICYGAWDVTTRGSGKKYWGVGKNEHHGCSDCCWTCGRKGSPRSINLTR